MINSLVTSKKRSLSSFISKMFRRDNAICIPPPVVTQFIFPSVTLRIPPEDSVTWSSKCMANPLLFPIHYLLYQRCLSHDLPQVNVTDGVRPVDTDLFIKVCSFDTFFSVILRVSEPQSKTDFALLTLELNILIIVAVIFLIDH